MAANDEFPRGGVKEILQSTAGQVAAITLPAIGGVSHVLDAISYRVISFAATTASNYSCGYNPGGSGFVELSQIMMGATAGLSDSDEVDSPVVVIPGASVIVLINNPCLAGTAQIVRLRWHDV